MKELIGKLCNIHLVVNGAKLYYNARIHDITDKHVFFTDKYGGEFVFSLDYLQSASVVKEEKP